MRIQYTCMTKQSHPKTLGAISFIILTEPFVTLQCDQELRRISFEDYGSEITKITVHIYSPFPYRSMSYIKSMFQISCKCKIVNRRRTTTNLRQPVIWVTQVSQVNQSFYWIWYLMLMFVGWRTQLHWWWWWWWWKKNRSDKL